MRSARTRPAGGAPLLDTAGATSLVPNVSFCRWRAGWRRGALARHQLRSLDGRAAPNRGQAGDGQRLAELQLALHRAIYVMPMGPIEWGRAEPPRLMADGMTPTVSGGTTFLMPKAEKCAVSAQALRESRDREITMMNVHLGVLVAAATVERQLRLAQGLSQSELEAAPTSPLTLPHGVHIPGINSRIEHFCRTPVYFTNPVNQVAQIYAQHARHVTPNGVSALPLCVDTERRSQPEWLREVVALAAQGHVFGQVA